MTVTREGLERTLARVEAQTTDPVAGIYGPGSMLWEINKEAFIFIGAGRAALLQTAHPFVAHGVDQHSKTKTDPMGRFQRTFGNVFAMVFGDLDNAMRSARRVHAIHDRITGPIRERVGAFDENSPYEANDEDALMWVHSTLWDTSIVLYELLFRKLTAAEKEAYYQETKRFAWLFGIPDTVLPATWEDFDAYNQRMWESDVLTVGEPARQLSQFLLTPPRPSLAPAMEWYKILTAGLLPEKIRHQYGFRYGRLEEEVFRASFFMFRQGIKAVPPRLRYFPAYVDAQRRLKGMKGPDRFGRLIDRAVLFGLKGNRAAA